MKVLPKLGLGQSPISLKLGLMPSPEIRTGNVSNLLARTPSQRGHAKSTLEISSWAVAELETMTQIHLSCQRMEQFTKYCRFYYFLRDVLELLILVSF